MLRNNVSAGSSSVASSSFRKAEHFVAGTEPRKNDADFYTSCGINLRAPFADWQDDYNRWAAGAVSGLMEEVMMRAFGVAKKIRGETGIASSIAIACCTLKSSEIPGSIMPAFIVLLWRTSTTAPAGSVSGAEEAGRGRRPERRRAGRRDGRRAAGQPIERLGHVPGQARRIDLEVLDDAVHVGVGRVQNLLDPVH